MKAPPAASQIAFVGVRVRGLIRCQNAEAGSAPSRENAKIIREKFPQVQLREFPDQPAAFQALVQGQVDAYTNDGIQLYGLGRFSPYPSAETGTCGFPARGAGLLLSRETQWPRLDNSLGHTIVSGIAGPRVASVTVAGRAVALSARRRAFLRVLRGVVAPSRVPVVVRYADGRTRRFTG